MNGPEMAIRKAFVDDRHRRFRRPVGKVKEAPLAQAGADGRKVIARHGAHERHLFGNLIPGLVFEQIECRLGSLILRGSWEVAPALTTPGIARIFSNCASTKATLCVESL